MWVHKIFGGLMVVLTSYFGVQAATTVGKIINNEHSYFAFPLMVGAVFTAALGAYTQYSLNLNKGNQWNTAELLANKKMHTIPAYASLGASFFALAYGAHYYRISPKHYSDFPIEFVEAGLFAAALIGAEAWHQYTIKDEKPF